MTAETKRKHRDTKQLQMLAKLLQQDAKQPQSDARRLQIHVKPPQQDAKQPQRCKRTSKRDKSKRS